MEAKNKQLSLLEVLEQLWNGNVVKVPLWQYKNLERIKETAFPIMGPLWIGVEIKTETYRVKRDIRGDYKRDPSKWF